MSPMQMGYSFLVLLFSIVILFQSYCVLGYIPTLRLSKNPINRQELISLYSSNGGIGNDKTNVNNQNKDPSSSSQPDADDFLFDDYSAENELMFSIDYDPLEPPNQATYERDLEDKLLQRSLRFYDKSTIRRKETCYLVGLEDRSSLYASITPPVSLPSSSSSSLSSSPTITTNYGKVDNLKKFSNGLDLLSSSSSSSSSFSSITTSSSNTKQQQQGQPQPFIKDAMKFSLEESLTELSELAGAAGLTVVGSTYQRVSRPSIEYYIGQGKTKEIAKTLHKLKCTCVIFDSELTPSQQKNLEMVLNQDIKNDNNKIKVIDRTALILDIFAQHARTKEGQLQVQLALLTYRLPRLTNMWSHLERQSAGSKGRSNGGVGLRGPGEKQLETDKRQMKFKISLLNRAIDAVRRHRSSHRRRRRQLGVPVIALVGYTNAGKSSLLNAFTQNNYVFASDMLFATLDPTTRLVSMSGMQYPDMLVTDTVGFIQKLPMNLVAAFRATLEEIAEADVLVHVSDITNDAWRKQEGAVLQELSAMGLEHKPLVRVWNKIDLVTDRKEYWKHEASRVSNTVAVSCITGEGMTDLSDALQKAICSTMEDIACVIPYSHTSLLNSLHTLGSLSEVLYEDEGIFVKGKLPSFLVNQVMTLTAEVAAATAAEMKMTTMYKNNDGFNTVNDDMSEEEVVRRAVYDYESELAVYTHQVDELDNNGMINREEEEEMMTVPSFSSAAASTDDEFFDWTDIAKGRHSAVGGSGKSSSSSSSSSSRYTSVSFSSSSGGTTMTGMTAATGITGVTGNKSNNRRVDISTTTRQLIQQSPILQNINKNNNVNNNNSATINANTGSSNNGKTSNKAKSTLLSQQQSAAVAAAEQYDLSKYGLSADGLLDFDEGEYGHHHHHHNQ